MFRQVNLFILALVCIQNGLVCTQKNSLHDKIFERLEHLESKVQRLEHLESKVQRLEHLESKVQRLEHLESKVQRLEHVESKVQNLQSEVRSLRVENNLLKDGLKDYRRNIKRGIGDSLISGQVPSVFAFSAELTQTMNQKIGQSHVFVSDHVECNYGGAYSNISGIFTAPKSGIFAFLWTIMAEGSNDGTGREYGEVDTELVVNSEVRRRAHTDTEVLSDDDQASGFVIVHLNQGDLVFIRSQYVPQGNLQVNVRGGWTFSGWQIA